MFARRKALQSAVSLARLASAPSERLVATSTLGEAFSKARAFIDTPAKATNATWRLSLGFAAAGACTMMTSSIALAEESSTTTATKSGATTASPKSDQAQKYKVVFVLGGPGSGKGTQSSKLVDEFGANVVHLSAGDLLRAHMKSGSPEGKMVADMIAQGLIVPSHVTISLLQAAMDASGKTQFLIDGFPRNEENRSAFEAQTGIEPTFILFFDCSEQEMEKRLLGRNEGRTDDNIETIRKRFRVFMESSLPVIQYYEKTGKVARINAAREPDEVYKEVKRTWLEFML